ncbi:MAG: cellulase family glycosylhydrolase [Pirellulales bacterium]
MMGLRFRRASFSVYPAVYLPIIGWLLLFGCFGHRSDAAAPVADPPMEPIRVSPDGQGFVLAKSGKPFVPWGVNYDHDERGRLIEDYWTDEWAKVEEDFGEIRDLSANVVRVHLQFGKFMDAAPKHDGKPNRSALERLAKLLELAEKLGLYLDVTGLGCYHKADVPAWYDALDERGRWQVQAEFWKAVAMTCRESPAVFCYDLMNEPVVAAGKPKDDWLGPAFAGKHFVQYITRGQAGRKRPDVAAAWTKTLVAAIREHDSDHLVTVGLVPWSLDRPGLTSGFVPEKIAPHVDFIAVHLYPESGKLDEALETLKGFAVGKPVVVEETFALKCSAKEWRTFVDRADKHAAGWVGFYWGQTLDECKQAGTIHGAIVAAWLEEFATGRKK